MNLLLIPDIYFSCCDDTIILTNHICLFQDDGNIRTCLSHKQKTYNMTSEDSDVDKNTDINVTMEIKIGKVSLNHDIPLSW